MQQQIDPQELLTTQEAAAYLKVGIQTLNRWARDKSNAFPAVRLGKAYRIRRGDLDDWYETQRLKRNNSPELDQDQDHDHA